MVWEKGKRQQQHEARHVSGRDGYEVFLLFFVMISRRKSSLRIQTKKDPKVENEFSSYETLIYYHQGKHIGDKKSECLFETKANDSSGKKVLKHTLKVAEICLLNLELTIC